jgi:hypothetical protein
MIKYLIIPLSSTIGVLFAIDTYIVQRANTVVEPTRIKVESFSDDIKEIKDRTKNIETILMNRRD